MATTSVRTQMDEVTETLRSEYACGFCKRRKVKCDRALPVCSICQKTQQECEYPVEAAKPGPKIGTTRRKRAKSRNYEERRTRPTAPERSSMVERGTSTGVDVDTNMALGLDGSTTSAIDANGPLPDNYPLTPVTTPLDVRTLAYIMHPSHDVATLNVPDQGSFEDMDLIGKAYADLPNSNTIARACAVMGISMQTLQTGIALYFDNMAAFSLFHRPSFGSKIQTITSTTQLVGLLSSMLSFSARFQSSPEQRAFEQQEDDFEVTQAPLQPPQFYEELCAQYVDEAMRECSNGPPPLCLFQALVLLTFQQMIKGVCTSSWRRLGLCIRVAYEMDLHHVDRDNFPEQQDLTLWCEIEERRRVWWAVWELDVFASMIKRCPSGIDWTENETRFPVSDEHWFNREFHPSCFLEAKPLDRLKALQRCGNESIKAWFIVLNSYMREGHVISKFRSPRPGRGNGSPYVCTKDTAKDTTDRLATLSNTLRCFSMALPKHLRYRNEYLSFSSRDPVTGVALRQLHSAKYGIHVLTQLARMMINHHDAYRGAQQDLRLAGAANSEKHDHAAPGDSNPVSLRLGPSRKGMQQYIEAADELLLIVSQSGQDHVRYVNPFFGSTIWYGAAVHLGWRVLAPPRTNHDLVTSKYEVMRMSLNDFTEFWDLPSALQENLFSMEEKLKNFTAAPKRRQSSSDANSADGGINQTRSMINVVRASQSGLWGEHQKIHPVISSPGAPDAQAMNNIATIANSLTAADTGIRKPHRPSFTKTNKSNSNSATTMASGGTGLGRVDSRRTGPMDSSGFVLDQSWSAVDTSAWQVEAPWGLWDDLELDLDYAFNPDELLFPGFGTYTNEDAH